MTNGTPYRGNDPTVEMSGVLEGSPDLKAIRRTYEFRQMSEQLLERHNPFDDRFGREFDQIAQAAQDWQAATFGQRYRALRLLVNRFGALDTYHLTLMAAPKSQQDWVLNVRGRKDTEKSDGGRRDRESEQRHWDYVIGKEVYQRMKAGLSKEEAIAAVKEDYRTGAPFPTIGDFPPRKRAKRKLPGPDAIEKILNRFRSEAKKRGYVDPHAASPLLGMARGSNIQERHLREPDLKLSDIPKRGRPRKK